MPNKILIILNHHFVFYLLIYQKAPISGQGQFFVENKESIVIVKIHLLIIIIINLK